MLWKRKQKYLHVSDWDMSVCKVRKLKAYKLQSKESAGNPSESSMQGAQDGILLKCEGGIQMSGNLKLCSLLMNRFLSPGLWPLAHCSFSNLNFRYITYLKYASEEKYWERANPTAQENIFSLKSWLKRAILTRMKWWDKSETPAFRRLGHKDF